MKCEYCGRERSWGGVVCCEKEAEGWANMALKRAPMTEQEELEAIIAQLGELDEGGGYDGRALRAAREILTLRKRVAELERALKNTDVVKEMSAHLKERMEQGRTPFWEPQPLDPSEGE